MSTPPPTSVNHHDANHLHHPEETNGATNNENNAPSAANEVTEFINQGFLKWEQARAQWLSSSRSTAGSTDTDSTAKAVAVPLEVDDIIDVIFSPRWRNPATAEEEGPPRRFPQNVPLPQMVDVLVDLWEAEGLDM